jgi:hypothetical protein
VFQQLLERRGNTNERRESRLWPAPRLIKVYRVLNKTLRGVVGSRDKTMRFIEMSGAQLMSALTDNDATPEELKAAGLTENCLVRINIHGDIEVRRAHGWDVIGGLIGEFEPRVKKAAGRDWA